MPILPSTLEYSNVDLQKKIDYIHSDLNKYLLLTEQKNLELHIDLVYPFFARERVVMSSLNLLTNLEIVEGLLQKTKKKCLLTVHFMGLLDDVVLFNQHLEKLRKNNFLTIELYIPLRLDSKMFFCQNIIPIYHWYDSDEYPQIDYKDKSKKLLMTVKAGKSGQKVKPDLYKQALEFVNFFGVENIIIDGGLTVDDYQNFKLKNKKSLRMVSYSSFWNEFINGL